ncbi:trypsin-like serine peptidase [Streptomyces glomeratus]|uniref:Trypsin-like peptidase domain-containing protein n=1 Tax=Streptomyces glomeratus TaxID=284452 RepID=A0ABP6LPP9_9ACTN|nr:trypsin-like peptidase domain-containing protein [Streptomyces glomeratus]MCF1511188.1 trypsin-like serine protease [Streptomyces glomeratus]
MTRITRPPGNRRHAFLGALVLLAVTASSVAAADGGPGPLGVTTEAGIDTASARVGALFGPGGALEGGHFCTASVVHSKAHNVIVTAAHCLGGGTVWFAPGYRDGKAPYGVWKVTRTYLGDGWTGDEDEDSDVAFAAVETVGGADIEDLVGGNRFVTGRETGATAVTVTGYPNSRETPIRCVNKPTAHSATQQRIDCPDFSSGTSGSPWVDGDGEVVGVLGGHEQGGSTADVSYSVVLKDEAADLYRTASGE